MPSAIQTISRIRVLIAGGSYAGLSCALNLLDLGQGRSPRMSQEPYRHHPDVPRVDFDITIVDERDGFFHLIGSPLVFADNDYARKAWIKYSDIPALQAAQNIKIIRGSVSSVDCSSKTAVVRDTSTKQSAFHSYDYFLAATGLRRRWPTVPQTLTREEYLQEADSQIDVVSKAKNAGVVVIGGGAVGIEMAAELKTVQPDIKVILAHSRDKLLSSEGLSDECKDVALDMLKAADVEVLMEHRLAKTTELGAQGDGVKLYELEFTNGHKLTANEVIMAISHPVSTATYLPPSALDEHGQVKINADLSLLPGTPNASAHFCAGDVTRWSGIKRCGGAMHGGHFVARNIHQSVLRDLCGHEPQFEKLPDPVPPMIGLAVGKNAVSYSPATGVSSGEDVMRLFFGDDLGFTICWNHLGLGGKKAEAD